MNKFVKSMLAVAATAAMLAPAVASTTIDGVKFNPGTQFITTALWEKTLLNSTDSLEGVGIVNKISCSGCGGQTWSDGNNNTQLTYYFSGFAVSKWLDVSGNWHNAGDEGAGLNSFANAKNLVFSGGSVKLFTDRVTTGTYLDPSANPNVVNPALIAQDIANATDGNLWLSYAGKNTFDVLTGQTGSLFASAGTFNNVHAGGAGFGYLDVVGGMAALPFNTDSWNVLGTIADARFDSSYSNTNGGAWPLSGTASFKTASKLPEPGSMALVAVALVGLGAAGRRTKKQ